MILSRIGRQNKREESYEGQHETKEGNADTESEQNKKEKTIGGNATSGPQKETKKKREKPEQEREERKPDLRGLANICFCSF